ncbi:unnamed protein product [Alternaria sp. RS040]
MSLRYSKSEGIADWTADGHVTSGDESGITSLTIQATDTRLDMIKSWIKACDEHHGSRCCIPKADTSIWPMWVIDVVDECIVEGDIADRYLTLSYVWGGVQTLQATTANTEQLKQPGSLTRDKVVLPKTIRQAIDVTRLLGERYIWIDQLSIVQDDNALKYAQIRHMAEIYSNSYLTLAAVTGDTADFGLVNDINQMLHGTALNQNDSDEDDTAIFMNSWSTWNFRGWTFQERVFARRILSFFDHVSGLKFGGRCPESLYWVCQRTSWYDWHPAVATESRRSLYKPMSYTWLNLGHQVSWPDFNRYRELCRSYSRRYFTYDSDVVIAFAGAVTLLAKSFPGGILYGLPVLFFDIALLWNFGGSFSERRCDASRDESSRPPSWSWMSQQGALRDFEQSTVFRGIGYIDRPSTLVINPLVQWYFTSIGGAQTTIANEYHKYKHFAQDSKSTPPPGWDRAESSSVSSGTYEENVYVTRNAPGWKFRFPIPLMDPSCSETMTPTPISNRITCNTERAYFYLAKEMTTTAEWGTSRFHVQVKVLDAGGFYSGIMYIHLNSYGMCLETDMRIELIAISTGSAADNDSLEDLGVLQEYHNIRGIYEFYNILLIAWTDGVAYRKAVGHVTKEAWEAADRELINVVLG